MTETTIGDPGLWSGLFKDDLVPQILDLVSDTWKAFSPKPKQDEKEVPITQRFKQRFAKAAGAHRAGTGRG
jgi:hypothetical protein